MNTSMVRCASGFLASIALSGCLVSDTLLFNAGNATASPLNPGVWRGCQVERGETHDCQLADVSRNPHGLYKFDAREEGEPPILMRFRKIAAKSWSAQIWGSDDTSPFYFLAQAQGPEISFSMIDCKELPDDFKLAWSANGAMDVEDQTTCVAKSVEAVDAAAREWAKTGAAKDGERIVYAPVAQTE